MGNAKIISGGISLNSTLYWMWVSAVFGAANHRVWELFHGYNDVELFYEDLQEGNISGITEKEQKSIVTTDILAIEKIEKLCDQKGIKIISYDDIKYPIRLKYIYNPPVVLFCLGSLEYIDDSVCLAVVGSREPSEYSVKVAKDICDHLAMLDAVVISGFAYGIDSVAHKSALLSNSRTVAVLGCGMDFDYPKENAKLKKVIAKQGAVITEYFPGTKPFGANFRQRNRIISGLSLGVLVVEASSKSGSLNTVMHALQQGKDIFCIPPHDIFDERYSGVIQLLRDGAIPVFSYLDLMYEYFENFSHKIKENSLFDNYFIGTNEVSGINLIENNNIEIKRQKENSTNIVKKNNDYTQLDEVSQKILKALEDSDMLADELSAMLDIEISSLLIILTDLELDGYVISLAGKRYALK